MTNDICTHCGGCCLAITCALGQALFLIKEEAICPAIETEDGLYLCGLISNTRSYISELVGTEQWEIDFMRDLFIKLVGVGIGCTNGQRTGKDSICTDTIPDLIRQVASCHQE